MNQTPYSVLMAVYAKESGSNLETAMNSVWSQTWPTSDFVLVCDGPLTEELENVIAKQLAEHSDALHIHRLAENQGLGEALNQGLAICREELVMRADSDDISLPNRAEEQIKYLLNNNLDVLSCTVLEFHDDPSVITGQRTVPPSHEDIVKFAKNRSPFNHPAVIFRKSAVEKAGGYMTLLYTEDYYLWIRMILAGARCGNTETPYVYLRAGAATIARRKRKEAYESRVVLLSFMRKAKFISAFRYYWNRLVFYSLYALPTPIVDLVYRSLHKKKKT